MILRVDTLPPGSLDLLNRLRDIHEPPPPGFWPPAPGWWLLALVVLAAVAWGLARAWSRYRQGRPLRQALAELEGWEHRTRADAVDPTAAATELSMLLKRAALTRYPPEQVAPLSGTAWLDFLDATGATDRFSRGPGQVLGDARYAPQVQLEVNGLTAAARAWLERHQEPIFRRPFHAAASGSIQGAAR